MWIARGLASYPEAAAAPAGAPVVVALGTFDGVHLGHGAILGTAVERGRALGIPAVACTFDPHPIEVLQPDRAPTAITTLDERLALIAETGVAGTIVIDFTLETAAIEPEAFVTDVVLGRLGAREVVVGFNHTFGRGARGNAELLGKLSERFSFRTHVVPPYTVGGVPVSSTAIRAALGAGEIARATSLLGRPHTVVGEVVRGAGRGRTLGFPTANVRPDRPLLVKAGVYACRVDIDGRAAAGDLGGRRVPRRPPSAGGLGAMSGPPDTFEGGSRGAVVNIGIRPTFGETVLAVEAFVFDFDGDLYGTRLRLHFVARVRDEQRFPSVEALKAQIAADLAEAKRLLAEGPRRLS